MQKWNGVIFIKISDYENIEDDIDTNNEKFKDIMYIYSQALKVVEQKINIIKYDYEYNEEYHSIDHVMSRIKSPESILKKMQKDNKKCTYKDMIEDINDIAGIRIICPLKSDVYKIRDYIREFNDIEIIKEKDYIEHPKESGYKSYHIILKVPIFIGEEESKVKVEIQIRTLAMDFWASLEHKLRYKPNGEINDKVSVELMRCAEDINMLDEKMINLFQK